MFKNNINQHHFLPDNFFTDYWQKKPILIRQAFPNFDDPVTKTELINLAIDDHVESRLVQWKKKKQEINYGPFLRQELPSTVKGWTLLINHLEQYSEKSAALLDQFRFIPHWRLQDVMASYSVAEGSVGMHVDEYDVFIIQGMGQRRWQVEAVAANHQYAEQESEFLLVEKLIPEIDEILEAGDLLYIPPGAAHSGISLTPCFNYSVGFRAPNQLDLLQEFAEDLTQQSLSFSRYADPERQLTLKNRGEIQPQDQQKLRQLLHDIIDDDTLFLPFLGRLLSRSDDGVDNEFDDQEYTQSSTAIINLHEQPLLVKAATTQIIYLNVDHYLVIFVNGVEECRLSQDYLPVINYLADERQINSQQLVQLITTTQESVVKALLQKGLEQQWWNV